MPAEWLAAIITHESNGNVSEPGDPEQGEYGLLQITQSKPGEFGLPADSRFDPETNIAIGVLEYSTEAALWALRHPDLVVPGSRDAWLLARLSFAVGRSGSYRLADAAGVHTRGDVYGDIQRWVAENGGIPLGRQSADVVWFRTLAIPVQWQTAEAAAGHALSAGPPTLIPAPPGGQYSLPAKVAGLFRRAASPFLFLLLAGALVGGYLYLRRRP